MKGNTKNGLKINPTGDRKFTIQNIRVIYEDN